MVEEQQLTLSIQKIKREKLWKIILIYMKDPKLVNQILEQIDSREDSQIRRVVNDNHSF